VIDVEQLGVRVDEPPGCSVALNVVDELLSGTRRLAQIVSQLEYEHVPAGSQKNWECFQWLAEQIDRHSKGPTSLNLGAHEAYRDWRP